MDYKIVRKENQKERLWTGGVSKELYIYPDGSTINSPFNFRVSTASINPGEYNFTSFKGYKRLLILLSGSVKLEVDGRDYYLKPFSHIFFSGDSHTSSLADETSIDFNLIFKENINLLDFKIVETEFSGNSLSSKAINIFYNLEDNRHIRVNNNEYTLRKEDTLIACGNNFNIEGNGRGIILSLDIKI
ncbi:MAG: HutD family protein [Cetobacterium somerae]